LIGINDIGAGAPDSLIMKNYQHLMTRLSDELPRTMIYIQSILPTTEKWPNCPPEKIRRLNDQIQHLAIQHHFKWIDLYPYFATEDNTLIRNYTDDGLHLNAEGYKRWVNLIEKYITD
jgi:lysophospholipase L1-like esterase